MHARGRNRVLTGTRYLIDFRSLWSKFQVTKGAHVWSWRNTCRFFQLRAGHALPELRDPLANRIQGL